MSSLNNIVKRVPTHTTHLKRMSHLTYQRFLSSENTQTLSKVRHFLRLAPSWRWQERCCPLCPYTSSTLTSRFQSTSTREFQDSLNKDDLEKTVFHNQPSSWLFVSNKTAGEYRALVKLDLGLNVRLHGSGLEDLQRNIKAREMTLDLEKLVSEYEKMMEAERRREELKAQSEILLEQLRQQEGKSQEEVQRIRSKLKEMKQEIKDATKQFYDIEEVVYVDALRLPNDLHPSTPLGEDAVILKEKAGTREPQKMNHVEAGETHGLIKFSSVGPSAYYLRGELAVAEWTVSDLACDYMQKKGFRQISGPEFFKSPIVEGCGRDFFNTDEVLTLQHVIKDSVEPMNHLGGISAMSFAAYVARLCIADSALPFNLFSCGKTYQKNDLPGLFGATQSTQVGLFSCLRESEVDAQFEVTTEVVWTLLQSLGFSLRLAQIPASKLRREERRRVELQVFAPSLNDFIPIGQVSDLGDFVSRRLMTSHNEFPGRHQNMQKLHMISGTVVNITSLLATWVEHTDFTKSGL